MNDLQLELTRLIGKSYMEYIEGCQAFSEICGKKDESGKFICQYCHRWRGQDREELMYSPATLSDLHRWLNLNKFIWEQRANDIKLFDPICELIDYDSDKDLLDQYESMLKAIIDLIKRHELQND